MLTTQGAVLVGGEVLYTEDITFSSSNLSNRVMSLYPEETAAYLKDLRARITVDDVKKEVAAVEKKRCLVIGDTILDEYIYVEPLGKPAKENIIATKYKSREIFCGGAIATANLVGQVCASNGDGVSPFHTILHNQDRSGARQHG